MIRKIAIAGIALCLAGAAQAQQKELRYATAAPEKTPWGKFLNDAIVDVQAAAPTLKIVPYFSSALGDEQTALRQTVRGRIDISGQSGVATSLVVPSFALLGAPYLFESAAQSDCMFDNYIRPIFEAKMKDSGLVILSWVEVGHSYTQSKAAIRKIPDIKGMKVRIAPTRSQQIYFNELGANGVPMGVVDMVPALKTGQVDAITTSVVYGMVLGLPKLAPFTLVHNATHDIGTVTVSRKTWDTLSDTEKNALYSMDKRVNELRTAIRGAEVALLQRVEKSGAPVYRLSNEEKRPWRAAAARTYPKLVNAIGGDAPRIWAAILKAKASCT